MSNIEEMTLKGMQQILNTEGTNALSTDSPVYAVATMEGKEQIIGTGSKLGMPELEAEIARQNEIRARFLGLPALEVSYVPGSEIDKSLLKAYFDAMDERDEMRDEM